MSLTRILSPVIPAVLALWVALPEAAVQGAAPSGAAANVPGPAGDAVVTEQNFGTVTYSISDSAVVEGNFGSTPMTFTVTAVPAPTELSTVGFATGTTGGATSGVDYVGRAGSLVFFPGNTSRTFDIGVLGDTIDEANESFYVNLSNPGNGTIADGQGRGQINDNDPLPKLRISNGQITEGDAGFAGFTVTASFTVTLSAGDALAASLSGRTVKVTFATGTSGSATRDVDYQSKSGDLTFQPGSTSKIFKIVVNGDNLDEANESFFVNLSNPVNATIDDGQGQGTILDNDPTQPGAPTVSIADASAFEGSAGTVNMVFTVALSESTSSAVTVTYATGAAGTATSGVDYTPRNASVTFAAGEISKTLGITILSDQIVENDETFFVNLTSAGNATIADSQAKGTIRNDDDPVIITVTDFEFSPPLATVPAGQSVVWFNAGDFTHTATASGGQFNTGNIFPGGTSARVVIPAGTFGYFCNFHPGMTATVSGQ